MKTTNTAKPLGSLAREYDLAQDRDYLCSPTAADRARAAKAYAEDEARRAFEAAEMTSPMTDAQMRAVVEASIKSDTLDPLIVLFPDLMAQL